MNKQDIEKAIELVGNIFINNPEPTIYQVLQMKEDDSGLLLQCEKLYGNSATVRIGKHIVSSSDLHEYCKYLDNPPEEFEQRIGMVFPLEHIEVIVNDKLGKEWNELNANEKKQILYKLGMDVKDCSYVVKQGVYRDPFKPSKQILGYVVMGSERVDKVWQKNSKASFEAKMHSSNGFAKMSDIIQILR